MILAHEPNPQILTSNPVLKIPTLEGKQTFRDEEDFKKIYDAYFFRLLAYARLITKSDELAKDAVADVFLNLWNSKKGEKIKDFESYLIISTKHQCYKVLKKENKYVEEEDLFIQMENRENNTPEELMLTQETIEVIAKSIDNLSDQCKLVFKFVKEEGMSYQEVATELHISKNTVRNHLYRAVNQIRTDLDNYFGEKGGSRKIGAKISVNLMIATLLCCI